MITDPILLFCIGYLAGALTVLIAMFPAWFVSLVYEVLPRRARDWLNAHRVSEETRVIYYILVVIVPLMVIAYRVVF